MNVKHAPFYEKGLTALSYLPVFQLKLQLYHLILTPHYNGIHYEK